jgi:hypothetical protein
MKKTPLFWTLSVLLLAAAGFGYWQARHRSGVPGRVHDFPENSPTASPSSPAARRDGSVGAPGGGNSAARVGNPVPYVVGWYDDFRRYQERVASIHLLTTNLSAADQETLRLFLAQANVADGSVLGEAYKNELMDVLCAWNPPPAWLGETLIQVYHDRSQDGVIRDYAVQHMTTLYEQMELVKVNDPRGKRALFDTLTEALNETDSSIGGTALLGLAQLAAEWPEQFDRDELAKMALNMAGDSRSSELSRISAFQICARLKVADALPVLIQEARGNDSVPLRISAIAAVGTLGDANAKPLLTELLNGPEARFRLPAQGALEQIVQREQQRTQ